MLDDEPQHPMLQPGFYRHYKGGYYLATQLAFEEGTMESVVVYHSLDSSVSFTRPLSGWRDVVANANGHDVYRFTQVTREEVEVAGCFVTKEAAGMTQHELFHTLWTKAVGLPGYNKHEWLVLAAMIDS